jgi:hypothetical protein
METISARHLQPPSDATPDGPRPSPRERVAAHCRARARGVDARTAHARTIAFFRAGGRAGAPALPASPA